MRAAQCRVAPAGASLPATPWDNATCMSASCTPPCAPHAPGILIRGELLQRGLAVPLYHGGRSAATRAAAAACTGASHRRRLRRRRLGGHSVALGVGPVSGHRGAGLTRRERLRRAGTGGGRAAGGAAQAEEAAELILHSRARGLLLP